jgi:hypothetical protein
MDQYNSGSRNGNPDEYRSQRLVSAHVNSMKINVSPLQGRNNGDQQIHSPKISKDVKQPLKILRGNEEREWGTLPAANALRHGENNSNQLPVMDGKRRVKAPLRVVSKND